MTRILFWNIEKLSTNKLFPPPHDRQREGPAPKRQRINKEREYLPGPGAASDADDLLKVLLGVVKDAQPDVISIVEINAGKNPKVPGTLVNDSAAYQLLLRLRQGPPGDWRLVPPLMLGTGRKTEGIAVYYRESQLDFIGPWGWNGQKADSINNILAANLAPYPAPWTPLAGQPCLPNRPVLAGEPPAMYNENTLAGQWQFRNLNNEVLGFPGANDRTPWLTWFRERGGALRVIKLMSFHAPPKQLPFGGAAPASEGTAALANVREMSVAPPLGPNEVRCIAGDFNVSAWQALDDPASFALIRGRGYIQQLNPLGGATPGAPPPPAAVPYGWPAAGYYATMIRNIKPFNPDKGAHPWVTTGNAGVVAGYPGYGWAGRRGPTGWYDAIDNIFTRHFAGAAGELTVANPITAAPYDEDPNPPAGVKTGDPNLIVQSRMEDPNLFGFPPGIPEVPPKPGEAAYDRFRRWESYGQIRALSDHLPLVIDV